MKAPLGYPDTEVIVEVPLEGELPSLPPMSRPVAAMASFHARPALKIIEQPAGRYETFFVWIEERSEWIGLRRRYYSEYVQNVWGGGIEEYIGFEGPFCLNVEAAELIRTAYGLTSITFHGEILRTTPIELCRLASLRQE